MKKSFYVFAAICAIACTKENAPQQNPSSELVKINFGATLEQPKTSISAKSTLWQADDAISIFDGADNRPFTAQSYGETSTTFLGEAAQAETYYALYPYSSAAALEGETIKTILPTEQTAIASSYDPAASLMVAKSSGSNNLDFKNVCTLVKIDVPSNVKNLKSIEIKSNNGKKIAGNVSITFDAEGLPVATGDAETVTLKAAEGQTLQGEYYICVLPGIMDEGISLLLRYGYSAQMFQQAKVRTSVDFSRSHILPLGSVKNPEIAFIGSVENAAFNDETNTAIQWLLYEFGNTAYIPFEVLNTESSVLDNCKAIWWHLDSDSAVHNKDELVSAAPKSDWGNVLTLLKDKLAAGTGFLLTRYAAHYPVLLGLTETAPDICFDDANGITTVGTEAIYTTAEHDIFSGLSGDDPGNSAKICLLDAGYLFSNATVKYSSSAFPSSSCTMLAKDGDGNNAVIWEFPKDGDRGAVICIGTPFYDWHTTYGNWVWGEGLYHNNVLDITRNAINYVKQQ